MQRTAIAATFLCLGLSFLAFVIVPDHAPAGIKEAEAPLIKDESALIQKEVTVHRSSTGEQDTIEAKLEEANRDLLDADAEAGLRDLLAYQADADAEESEVLPPGYLPATFWHDRSHKANASTKYMLDGVQIADSAWKGAWEIEDATQDYLKAMDNMTKFIGDAFSDRHGDYYLKYMVKVVEQLQTMIGNFAISYMDIVTVGLNATSSMNERPLNQSKTMMNNLAKTARQVMSDVKVTIDDMNKQYVPGGAMGVIEEQMGGWRQLCPKIKGPMEVSLQKLEAIVAKYKEHSINIMDGLDKDIENFPLAFRPQVAQYSDFIDRVLGLNLNVWLKLQDDLFVGIESLALKFRLCNKPTQAPSKFTQARLERGSIAHKPMRMVHKEEKKEKDAAPKLGLGLAAAAVCMAGLM